MGHLIGILGLYCTIAKGNFWYTEQGVLRELQIENPGIARIMKVKTGVIDYTEITVQNNDGSTKTYYLDSDVLFN